MKEIKCPNCQQYFEREDDVVLAQQRCPFCDFKYKEAKRLEKERAL